MNRLIPQYLMHSYLYYELDDPVIEDDVYDRLCKFLLKNFNSLNHPHKSLLNKTDLECGTGVSLKYPNIVKDSALLLKSSWRHYSNSLLTRFKIL